MVLLFKLIALAEMTASCYSEPGSTTNGMIFKGFLKTFKRALDGFVDHVSPDYELWFLMKFLRRICFRLVLCLHSHLYNIFIKLFPFTRTFWKRIIMKHNQIKNRNANVWYMKHRSHVGLMYKDSFIEVKKKPW